MEYKEGAKTVQELIDLLQTVEDKEQIIHVWDRWGYYGTGLKLEIAKDQDGKPLIIESGE